MVLTVGTGVVTVKFVDYGSDQECLVSQVRPLQGRGEGLEIPAQSFPVVLDIKPTQVNSLNKSFYLLIFSCRVCGKKKPWTFSLNSCLRRIL